MRLRNIALAAGAALVVTLSGGHSRAAQIAPAHETKIPLSDDEYEAKMDEVEALISQGTDFLQQDKNAEAIVPLEKALAICEKYLGEGPFMVIVLDDLVIAYSSKKDFTRAESAGRRALTIAERVYDEEGKLRKVNAVFYLGILYLKMERYSEAEPLLLRAVEMTKAPPGEGADQSSVALRNLATLYRKTGRVAKAEAAEKEADALNAADPAAK